MNGYAISYVRECSCHPYILRCLHIDGKNVLYLADLREVYKPGWSGAYYIVAPDIPVFLTDSLAEAEAEYAGRREYAGVGNASP